jgi:hypothetical protein
MNELINNTNYSLADNKPVNPDVEHTEKHVTDKPNEDAKDHNKSEHPPNKDVSK